MLLKRLPLFIISLILFTTFIISQSGSKREFLIGGITESVKCIANQNESYTIFLPSSYSFDTKWPVIIVFEPAARSMIPVKLFSNSAEKYGYIVVCSNNSKNGPWGNVIRSMKSVWVDIQKRFSIDLKRVYTTGFSGGSRAASLFSKIIGIEPAGIIACGAGLQEKLTPSDLGGSFYYGIIGLEDFNYKEFRKLVPELEKANIRYCIDYIPGIHKWPDDKAINRAILWMETDAVLRENLKENPESVKSIYMDLKLYADSLVNSNKFFYGVRYLEYISRHFEMLLPVEDLKIKVTELKKKKKFLQFKKDDAIQLMKEYQFIGNFARVFKRIEISENKRIGLQTILNDLKVPYFVKQDRKKKKSSESYMAKRLLFEIAIKADRSSSINLKKGDEKKAVLYAEIASRTGINEDWYDLRLASIYAYYGKTKKCIKIIKSLLPADKDLVKYIERDPNFNEMLKNPDFMRIFITRD